MHVFVHMLEHLCMRKLCIRTFALINQSIKGCCLWKDTHAQRAKQPFVIAVGGWGGVIHPREQERQDRDKDGEKERGNPALSPAPGEISNSKVN